MEKQKLIIQILVLFILASCSKKGELHPPEAWGNGTFLEHASELKAQPEASPFHWIWVAQGNKIPQLRNTADKIIIPAVNLNPLWPDPSAAVDSSDREDAELVASFFHQKLIDSFQADKKLNLRIADSEASGAIILESALLELRPTKAALNAVTSVAGFFIPGAALVSGAISAGAGAAGGQLAKGSCGVAIKIRNGDTKELLLEAADRQDDQSALLVDLKGFSEYGHAKESLEQWAQAAPWLIDSSTPIASRSGLVLLSMW